MGRWILGDWQLNGIFSLYSGTPLGFSYSATTLNAPGNGNRPDVSGPIRILGTIGKGEQYFDTSVFSAPLPATFGNIGRNIMSGPGVANIDMGIFRKFPLSERVTGEFRMESFNFTNTPHFGNPSGSFGSSSFGQVTGAAADQRTFQFALKLTF